MGKEKQPNKVAGDKLGKVAKIIPGPNCNVGVLPLILQASVLQFDSVLTLSNWRQHQIPQIKGSAPQDCPPCQRSTSSTRSPGFLQFLSDLPINWSFPCPPLTPPWIQLIFIMVHKTQENSLLTVVKN